MSTLNVVIIGFGCFILGVVSGLVRGWIEGYGDGLKESENQRMK